MKERSLGFVLGAIAIVVTSMSCGGGLPAGPPTAPLQPASVLEWTPSARGGLVVWENAPGFVYPQTEGGNFNAPGTRASEFRRV